MPFLAETAVTNHWHRLAARIKLLGSTAVGSEPIVKGRVWIHGGGTISIGNRVRFNAEQAPIELHAQYHATICIGDDVVLESGTSIEAQQLVTIGSHCRLGAFCKILDNHFHPLRGDRHQRPQSTPVILENHVQLGERTIVLPGAHLKDWVQASPGAVISRLVPEKAVVSGVPAKIVRLDAQR